MAQNNRQGASASIAGALLALSASLVVLSPALAAEDGANAPAVRKPTAHGLRPVRTAASRALTIRRRAAARPVDVVETPGFYNDYLVRQHSWNDPRLYYFGPFRTGGEVFYGDQAGNPITRGNAALGQIAGYGPARGGFGGPHFDAVGGFHQDPGPDAKIDADYASGAISTPDYAVAPHYASVPARVMALNTGVVSRGARDPAEGRVNRVAFDQAKARFAAPMARQAPIESAFANGGINSIGGGIGALSESPF